MSEKQKRMLIYWHGKKYEIVEQLRKGVSAIYLASSIPKTAINDIKRDPNKIGDSIIQMEATDGNASQKKSMKLTDNH